MRAFIDFPTRAIPISYSPEACQARYSHDLLNAVCINAEKIIGIYNANKLPLFQAVLAMSNVRLVSAEKEESYARSS